MRLLNNQPFLSLGCKRWWSDESTRLPPMWPVFKSRRQYHMWVEIDVGCLFSPLLQEVSLWVLRFSPLLKNQHFQFDQESGRQRTTLWMCYLQIIIYLLIY